MDHGKEAPIAEDGDGGEEIRVELDRVRGFRVRCLGLRVHR